VDQNARLRTRLDLFNEAMQPDPDPKEVWRQNYHRQEQEDARRPALRLWLPGGRAGAPPHAHHVDVDCAPIFGGGCLAVSAAGGGRALHQLFVFPARCRASAPQRFD